MFMKTMGLQIDMEFESKIPSLTEDELITLHQSILAEGKLISPIVVWNGIIVDGHNRYRFIREHPEIEYEIFEKDFADRNDAISWICKNQLGRRNLTPEQKKYLIGKQYEAEKQSHGGDRKSMYQNDTLNDNTGERIARENNMSRISVLRAEEYANAIDLADEAVPGIKDEILTGKLSASATEVLSFAKIEPEHRATYAEMLREPKSKRYKYNREHYRINYKNPDGLTIDEIVSQNTNGGFFVDDCLTEYYDALDSFKFRWKVCFRQHTHHLDDDEYVSGIRQYIKQATDFLKSVDEQLPAITDNKSV